MVLWMKKPRTLCAQVSQVSSSLQYNLIVTRLISRNISRDVGRRVQFIYIHCNFTPSRIFGDNSAGLRHAWSTIRYVHELTTFWLYSRGLSANSGEQKFAR